MANLIKNVGQTLHFQIRKREFLAYDEFSLCPSKLNCVVQGLWTFSWVKFTSLVSRLVYMLKTLDSNHDVEYQMSKKCTLESRWKISFFPLFKLWQKSFFPFLHFLALSHFEPRRHNFKRAKWHGFMMAFRADGKKGRRSLLGTWQTLKTLTHYIAL